MDIYYRESLLHLFLRSQSDSNSGAGPNCAKLTRYCISASVISAWVTTQAAQCRTEPSRADAMFYVS